MPLNPQIQVIYLQPVADDAPTTLGFEQFAAHVAQSSDPFSQRFAAHLLAWRDAAGSAHPATVRSGCGPSR
jgi:hypothetical protein